MDNRLDTVAFLGQDAAAGDLRIDEFSSWTDPSAAVAGMCWCRADDLRGARGDSAVR